MLEPGYRLARTEDLFNLGLDKDRAQAMVQWAEGREQDFIDIDDLPGAKGTGAWKRNGHNEGHGVLRIKVAVVRDYIEALEQAEAVMRPRHDGNKLEF